MVDKAQHGAKHPNPMKEMPTAPEVTKVLRFSRPAIDKAAKRAANFQRSKLEVIGGFVAFRLRSD